MDIIQDITVAGEASSELVYLIFLYQPLSIGNA
jgi:hypothetical protein